MIHPGFRPNHPRNQDDRRFLPQVSFFLFFCEMLGLSSYCHPGLKMAISAQHGPIILPSSWVVRLTSSVRAIILLSSYRQWFIAVVGTSFILSFASSWRHPGDLLFLDWGRRHPSIILLLARLGSWLKPVLAQCPFYQAHKYFVQLLYSCYKTFPFQTCSHFWWTSR